MDSKKKSKIIRCVTILLYFTALILSVNNVVQFEIKHSKKYIQRPITLNDMKMLKEGQGDIIKKMIEHKVSNRDIRGTIMSMKKLNDEQLQILAEMANDSAASDNINRIADWLTSVNYNVNWIKDNVNDEKADLKKIQDVIITTAGIVENIKENCHSPTTRKVCDEMKSTLLELRKEWGSQFKPEKA